MWCLSRTRVRSSPLSLEYPAGTQATRFVWHNVVGVAAIHALALLAFVPYCFSISGVLLRWRGCMSLAPWESTWAITGC